ncbi:MAG: DUF1858 domain-containing protein [bacterium]
MITRDTYIEDLVKEYPQTVAVLLRHRVVCIQCGEPVWGTLGETLTRAGISEQDKLINELNRIIDEA